jgi:hypothetical protein
MTKASAPPKPKQNWARISKIWLPIDQLPTGGTPVVLADETQTVTWFVEKPSKAPIRHTKTVRDEAGNPVFERGEGGQETLVTANEDVTPVYWSPAVYVDERGDPV